MIVATVIIDGREAAKIDDQGRVEVLEHSARLAEIVARFNLAKSMPGLMGLTQAVSAAVAMAEYTPEFKMVVSLDNLVIGDIDGVKPLR